MDWKTLVQAISVIVLTLVGLLPITYSAGRLTRRGWILIIVGSLLFVSTTILKEIEAREAEEKLHEQMVEIHHVTEQINEQTIKIEQIRERLFTALAPQVMKTPEIVSAPPVQKTTGRLRITSPSNGSEVPARTYLEGNVSDPQTKVWVVVHPLETGAYWVQPTVNVNADGNWKTLMYLGRDGHLDVGKHFQVMAIAEPDKRLSEAEVLNQWPEAEWKSQVIEVIRR